MSYKDKYLKYKKKYINNKDINNKDINNKDINNKDKYIMNGGNHIPWDGIYQ
jgi:hypothetical protein